MYVFAYLSMYLTYSISSFAGLVSSNLMCVTPLYAFATPKLKQIDFAWPRWRYPFGSTQLSYHREAFQNIWRNDYHVVIDSEVTRISRDILGK
jgi:hypothetical protein